MAFGNSLGENHLVSEEADLSRMCSYTTSPCPPNPSDSDEPGTVPCKFQLPQLGMVGTCGILDMSLVT